MTIYRLIDGAFFEGFCKRVEAKTGFGVFERLNWQTIADSRYRTIYYDALPIKKDKQSDEEFRDIELRKIEFLNYLRSFDNVHVRDGVTRLKTKQRAREISQVLEQKGVDTWIAVDAMQYALRGLAEQIEIFTSDSDLYPLFEAFQSTNCRGTLWYEEGRAPDELIYSADRAIPLTFMLVMDWAGIPRHEYILDCDHGQLKWEVEVCATPYWDIALGRDQGGNWMI